MAREVDIQRTVGQDPGPWEQEGDTNHPLTAQRGSNVWSTIQRIRLDLNVTMIEDDPDKLEGILRQEVWYGLQIASWPLDGDPVAPDDNPYDNPGGGDWLHIGMLYPVPVGFSVGDSGQSLKFCYQPKDPIDSRGMRALDEDLLYVVYLTLSSRILAGGISALGELMVSWQASTMILRRPGS